MLTKKGNRLDKFASFYPQNQIYISSNTLNLRGVLLSPTLQLRTQTPYLYKEGL